LLEKDHFSDNTIGIICDDYSCLNVTIVETYYTRECNNFLERDIVFSVERERMKIDIVHCVAKES